MLAEFAVGGFAKRWGAEGSGRGPGLRHGRSQHQRNTRLPEFTTNYTISANCPYDAAVFWSANERLRGERGYRLR